VRILTERAPAKVNLTLRVLGRRADGYHELESLVAFTAAGDEVSYEPEATSGTVTAGPFAAEIVGDNLIDRVCALVRERLPALSLGRVTLEKRLPVAAGMGGGSADAAALLRLLQRAHPDVAALPDLHALALRLGADVPVCLAARSALMTGVGERLMPVAPLPEAALLLVNPRVPLATAEVFAALAAAPVRTTTEPRLPGPFLSVDDLAAHVRAVGNDLAVPAARLQPVIEDVLAALGRSTECLVAAQTGSGPTCFGLFSRLEHAEAARDVIARARSDWWLCPTTLLPS
jgi:4-diphosphocytidyl-2-C-methyl-D-erythritol kinase